MPDGNGGTLASPSATGGVIRGSANKAYLTPIEQPPPPATRPAFRSPSAPCATQLGHLPRPQRRRRRHLGPERPGGRFSRPRAHRRAAVDRDRPPRPGARRLDRPPRPRADTNIFYARSDDHGATFTPNRQLDDSRTGFDVDHDTPTNQGIRASPPTTGGSSPPGRTTASATTTSCSRPASMAAGRSRAPSAWTTRARARANRAGRAWRSRRGESGGSVYVAWEDDRQGTNAIYLARRACGRP